MAFEGLGPALTAKIDKFRADYEPQARREHADHLAALNKSDREQVEREAAASAAASANASFIDAS